MKVTFVYPDFFQYPDGSFLPEGRIYLGVAYLSAYLKEVDHSTELIHLVAPPAREELVEKIKASDPDLIAISSTTHMFRHATKWAGWLKEIGAPVICGGVHATIAPEEAISIDGIDMICRGEGEEALAELCEAMAQGADFSHIKNLWIKRGDDIIRNPVRPLLTDLDRLPFPDREIFDPALFCPDQHPRGTLMASRGCPFNCSYCSNHAQKRAYPNPESYVRFRSPPNVIREIREMLATDDGIEYIRFDDDILNPDREWLAELMGLYSREIGLPFICNSRVNFMDRETASSLAEGGCQVVCMGIESGNPWLRKNILNRHMSNESIEEAFRLCREAGIKTVSTNMTGLPRETTSMVLDTIKLNARCRPNTIQVSTFIPYPNTKLYELCAREGLLSDERIDSIFEGRTPLLKEEEDPVADTVRASVLPLVGLYRKLSSLGNEWLSRWSVALLGRLILSPLIPQAARHRVLRILVGYAEKRFEQEWIKY